LDWYRYLCWTASGGNRKLVVGHHIRRYDVPVLESCKSIRTTRGFSTTIQCQLQCQHEDDEFGSCCCCQTLPLAVCRVVESGARIFMRSTCQGFRTASHEPVFGMELRQRPLRSFGCPVVAWKCQFRGQCHLHLLRRESRREAVALQILRFKLEVCEAASALVLNVKRCPNTWGQSRVSGWVSMHTTATLLFADCVRDLKCS